MYASTNRTFPKTALGHKININKMQNQYQSDKLIRYQQQKDTQLLYKGLEIVNYTSKQLISQRGQYNGN